MVATVHIATLTLAAIEEALCSDQGATFRRHLGQLMPLASDAYRSEKETRRGHLGASLIGRECARELWYSFHWATTNVFEGRILRLFNRGHLEEPRFLALLRMIGCEVWFTSEDGGQLRIHGYRGHFGGSLDGVVRGIPDMPDIPMVLEAKTHSNASFTKLKQKGVRASKWEHTVQMQMYMGKQGLTWGLYCACNKDNDELHLELLQFDEAVYQRYQERAAMIIDSRKPPPKISQSAGWFGCRFCSQKAVCHGGKVPDTNCRTCQYATVQDGGAWLCQRFGPITAEVQAVGCPHFELHNALT